MSELTSDYNDGVLVLLEFLKKLWFFSSYDREALERLAINSLLGFYPKGTVILQQGVSSVNRLLLVERGAVKLYRKDSSDQPVLSDLRGEGGLVGVDSILTGSMASHTVEAVEDTFCFLIDKEQFLEFARENPTFAEHYYRGLSGNLVGQTYCQLRSEVLHDGLSDEFRLACTCVGDVVRRDPIVIDSSETINCAARLMTISDVDVLLVSDSANVIVGIISDRDLRSKVVAQRVDYDQPVATVMSRPVISVEADSSCLDAVMRMLKSDIHHLVVNRGRETAGVISALDILASQETSPLFLMEEIDRQTHFESLYGLGKRIPQLIRNLVEVGAKAHDITRIVSILNDHLVARILTLLQEQMGPPPVQFAWMVMGSEGRMEQTLRTDQDNAIIYEDPDLSWDTTKAAKLYFRSLGNQITPHLVECGFPLCKGGYMASKSMWRKPFSVWTGYFDEWMSTADQYIMLNAKIFLDFRCGYGDESLTERLRDYVMDQAGKNRFFINHLSKDSLTIKPPLSFLRNFIVERDEEHKNRLDLKMRGLVPVVDFARAMAMKYGIRETNTTARLKALSEESSLDTELCNEVLSAYEFLMQLRLVHQLHMIQQGLEPDNFVDPANLSDLEKQTLKGAFGVINRMQTYMAKVRTDI